MPGTAVTVKAVFEEITYAVTVTNGTGGGNYAAGATVNITADTAPTGQKFKEWTSSDGVTFAGATSASTTFTMLAKAVTVKATYEALPPSEYAITVQNDGHGTANANVTSASAGTEITLTATPDSGYKFKEWQVVSGGVTIIANKFTMPGTAVTVKAVFEEITYAVTVTGGTTDKAVAAEGETVTITAGTAPAGQEFDKWTTSDGVSFANENNASTTFVMPSKAVAVTATFKALPPSTYAINVQNDGNGMANADVTSATAGTVITLSAVPSSGYKFKAWEVVSGGVTITDNKFTMPSETVTVKATFELISTPTTYTITSGADGSWKKGTTTDLTITCDGDIAKFTGIKVDGTLIDPANYTKVSGSTIITLKASYLETLSVGAHTVEFVYSDGTVQTGLTILKADGTIDPTDPTDPKDPTNPTVPEPNTGDNFSMLPWIIFCISAMGLIVLLFPTRKRRGYKF